MKTATVILAGLALVAGGAGAWLGAGARSEAATAASRASALETRVGDLEAEAAGLRTALDAERETRGALEGRVEALSARLDQVVAGVDEIVSGAREAAASGGVSPVRSAMEGAARKVADVDPAMLREYEDLLGKVFGGTATAEEQQRFWKVVRTEGFMDAVLAGMEAGVAAAPDDADGRMELANAYISKLFTVPPGPEMGTWAAKAEGQWKEVLTRDEDHWSARFALATSYARYPEFLNKTPDAIKEFERVRKVQETLPVEAKQAQTYVELGLLYIRQNNTDQAREVLEAGNRRHPENESIRKTLETLGR